VANTTIPPSNRGPDLAINELNIDKEGEDHKRSLHLKPGEEFYIRVWISNVGTAEATTAYTISYLLSYDDRIDQSDILIDDETDREDIPADKRHKNGRHVHAPLTPGVYYVGARVDSSQDMNKLNDFSRGYDERARITVDPPTYNVTGRVLFNGLGLGGVTVALRGTSRSVTTNSNGIYSFQNVARGSYTVAVRRDEFYFTPYSVNITVNNGNVAVPNIIAMANVITPVHSFMKIFDGALGDKAYAVQQTRDGGYILTGLTNSTLPADSGNTWLIKTDVEGNIIWDKTFGVSGDRGYSVLQTEDGGYILLGMNYGFGGESWLIKTDEFGEIEWEETLGRSFSHLQSLQPTSDGGYVLASPLFLVKTNAYGKIEWNKGPYLYNCTFYDEGHKVLQTRDGGYILVSSSSRENPGDSDIVLIKTDANGNSQWVQYYGGDYDEVAASVVQTVDGGYVIAGKTLSFGAGSSDFWLIKTDAYGNMEWDKTFGGTGAEQCFDMQQTSDGGYILVGYSLSVSGSLHCPWAVKTDALGNIEWDKFVGGYTGFSSFSSVDKTNDGGFILAGVISSTEVNPWTSRDVLLVKIDADGNAPDTPTP